LSDWNHDFVGRVRSHNVVTRALSEPRTKAHEAPAHKREQAST
jgi:hypothetical protein